MSTQSITFEENGFPTELFDDRDIERAVAAGRLVAETIVCLHDGDGPRTVTRARDVPRLRPFFGIEESHVAPAPIEAAAVVAPPPPPHAAWHDLAKGQNIAIPPSTWTDGPLHVRIDYAERTARALTVDISAFLLRDRDQVGSDDDMVFYNNGVGDGGAVRLSSADPGRPRATMFSVWLQDISADVRRLYIAASLDLTLASDSVFGDANRTTIEIVDPARDNVLARYDHTEAGPETALILGELYRRNAEWKFRAVGQGYVGGLRALAQSLGVEVD